MLKGDAATPFFVLCGILSAGRWRVPVSATLYRVDFQKFVGLFHEWNAGAFNENMMRMGILFNKNDVGWDASLRQKQLS